MQLERIRLIRQMAFGAVVAAGLAGISVKAQTWTFDDPSSASFIPSSSFNYSPTIPNFRYGFGSANSSATFQWSPQDADGSATSGSIESSLTLNEAMDTTSSGGAVTIDLSGSGINASTLSFGLMIAPGSATDKYGGYGDLVIATATGGWLGFNPVWSGPPEEPNWEFGTSWGVPYTAGTWYRFNIPLDSTSGTGINGIDIQVYDGGAKDINGTVNFYVDNLKLTTVPEPSPFAMLLAGGALFVGLTIRRGRLSP